MKKYYLWQNNALHRKINEPKCVKIIVEAQFFAAKFRQRYDDFATWGPKFDGLGVVFPKWFLNESFSTAPQESAENKKPF